MQNSCFTKSIKFGRTPFPSLRLLRATLSAFTKSNHDRTNFDWVKNYLKKDYYPASFKPKGQITVWQLEWRNISFKFVFFFSRCQALYTIVLIKNWNNGLSFSARDSGWLCIFRYNSFNCYLQFNSFLPWLMSPIRHYWFLIYCT